LTSLRLGGVTSTTAAAQATERVLADLTVEAPAGEVEGHCLIVAPGALTATVQLVDTTQAQPVKFGLGPGWNSDEPRVDTMVATAPVTYSIPVGGTEAAIMGGRYCYTLQNMNPVPEGKPSELDRDWYRPHVAFRLTWSPDGRALSALSAQFPGA
jgi:hypothetical protein